MKMTVNKSSWAWSAEIKSASVKLVLIAMAECASERTLTAWPSIANLSDMTGMNRKTIISNLSKLVSMGFIEDTGDRAGMTSRIVVYRLLVP